MAGGLSVGLGGVAGVFAAFTGGMEGGKGEISIDWDVVDRTNTLVIGFSGHVQDDDQNADALGDDGFWEPSEGAGVNRLAAKMVSAKIPGIEKGNILLVAEDPYNHGVEISNHEHCGQGVHGFNNGGDGEIAILDANGKLRQEHPNDALGAIHAVQYAVEHLGVKKLAFFGYSHGGSNVRLLTQRIWGDSSLNPQRMGEYLEAHGVKITFTAYMDAVRIKRENEQFPGNDDVKDANNPFGPTPESFKAVLGGGPLSIEFDEPEYRFPYATKYHVNVYQLNQGENQYSGVIGGLRGGPLDPGLFNIAGSEDDRADQPPVFAQANVEEQNDPRNAPDPNNTSAPAPWVEGINHAKGPGTGGGMDDSEVIYDYIVHHMTEAFKAP